MADFLYKGVVDWFLDQMSQALIVPGDRMPSLRVLSKELGLSLNTVIHGYELLSNDGWIESRPKSGYFVCHRSDAKPALLLSGEKLQKLVNDDDKSAWSCLAHRGALVDQSDTFLAPNIRQDEIHLPVLGKGLLTARESVSDYLKGLGIKAHASQLWLGGSPLAMFTQSVQNITHRNDTVLVLEPCDPRITSTLQSLGRKVMTITAGDRGVDLDLVISSLRDESVSLIVLPGQFSFPAGQLTSNLSLRRWLAIIEETKLPTIEWDLCSHLAYRTGSILTYKSLDQSDRIIYIGGVESKGVGRSASWCLPGRYQAVLEGAFLSADMALSDAQQTALSDALRPNSKRSLTRRARDVWANSERVKSHLESHLGDHVSFATSKGGMSLWMYLSEPLDIASMTSLLAGFRHVIVPGSLVSHEPDANHWLAVNVTLDDVEPLAKSLAEHLSIDDKKTAEKPELLDKPEETDELDKPDETKYTAEASAIEDSFIEASSNQAQIATNEETIEGEVEDAPTEEQASKGDEKELDDKKKDTTAEPLYNPMLDLINHDFG